MLNITIQNSGEAIVLRCSGRLVIGSTDALLCAASRHPYSRDLVLDLAEIRRVDAAGIGTLVSLRAWAHENQISLNLMNLTPHMEALLDLFHLRSVFEICSVSQMLDLMCDASQHPAEDEAVSWTPARPSMPGVEAWALR